MRMIDRPSERDNLRELLHTYNEQPDKRAEIAEEIERRFQRPLALLVIDSCGFSRSVRSTGIIHFLALLERLQRLIGPIIVRFGGRQLSAVADNVFAVFDTAAAAVSCADEIVRHVDLVNDMLAASEEVYVSIGVGYGSVLVVDYDHIWGDEMNVASKLGEDLADKDEILLTTAAREALGDSPHKFERVTYSISGLELPAFRMVRES